MSKEGKIYLISVILGALVGLASCCNVATKMCSTCINTATPEGKQQILLLSQIEQVENTILQELNDYKNRSRSIQRQLKQMNKDVIIHLEMVER